LPNLESLFFCQPFFVFFLSFFSETFMAA